MFTGACTVRRGPIHPPRVTRFRPPTPSVGDVNSETENGAVKVVAIVALVALILTTAPVVIALFL